MSAAPAPSPPDPGVADFGRFWLRVAIGGHLAVICTPNGGLNGVQTRFKRVGA